jgi:uncharacterized membrane protein
LGASVVASLAIAGSAQIEADNRLSQTIGCAIGGVAGSLADSLLGAVVQEQRWCERCGVRTELPVHACGHQTRHVSGAPAVNNDVVNFVGVMTGGLTAAAVSAVLQKLTERNGSRVEFAATLSNSRLSGDPGTA